MNREYNDFSLEDSEALINNLKSDSLPEFEKLRSTLNLLSHVNELSPISIPPVLPSEIGQPVQLLTRKSSKSRRTFITSILSIGILASASLAAAAVTGRGPAPIVNAGRESAKLVKAVAGAVSQAVTGRNPNSPTRTSPTTNGGGNESGKDESSEQSGDSERSLTGPSSLPSAETENNKSTSNSDSDDSEGNSNSATASPSTKSEHSGDKGSKESGKSTPTAKPEPTSSAGDESASEEND